MADETGATPPETPQMPQMKVLGQFIRDLSFENILAQKPVEGEVVPDVQVKVAMDAKKRSTEGQYEVLVKLEVTSKNKDKDDVLFLLELQYGGVFAISNVAEAQLHPYLMIECPRMLFPFMRRIVSDITRDGGFPPLNLDQIDFLSLYRQQILQRASAGGSGQA